MSATTLGGGRAFRTLVNRIMGEIGSGRYQRGSLLPSTRALGARYGTSQETARRGLKALEEQGVLISEGRAGFRVARVEDDRTGCPVAFITRSSPCRAEAQPASAALFLAFQAGSARRGWPLLGAHGGVGGVEAITSQLRKSNSWGIICDTIVEELQAAIAGCGLPTVMVNSWAENSTVSAVLQDNYRGGFLAADHLIRQGVKRLGWVGPTAEFGHSRERFAGANAALSMHGRRIDEDHIASAAQDGVTEAVTRLLDSGSRPEGVLAFGLKGMLAVKQAGERLGLVIGSDLAAVGWTVDECYDQHYLTMFRRSVAPPAVVWSAASMAERALSLLCEIGEGLIEEPLRLCVPTRLRFDGKQVAHKTASRE
jgi:DNA-binding LacI/PurR family transcriptional regulator